MRLRLATRCTKGHRDAAQSGASESRQQRWPRRPANLAAFTSIGFTVAAWMTSLKAEPGTGLARADRRGIFVGEWAPTFFGLGVALSHYEQHDGTLTASVHDLRQRQEAS